MIYERVERKQTQSAKLIVSWEIQAPQVINYQRHHGYASCIIIGTTFSMEMHEQAVE